LVRSINLTHLGITFKGGIIKLLQKQSKIEEVMMSAPCAARKQVSG